MKPSGTGTSFISLGLNLHSRRIETAAATAQAKPAAAPKSDEREDERHKEFLRQQTLKRAVTIIRSKSKTQQLVELCEQLTRRARKSDAWFAKYEKFLRSPVWKLVSDEAIRKARFKCECWGCSGRAMQVYLLEFPEEHLDLDFDWMNRNNILIALCNHHYEIMHRFVIKRIVPLERQFESGLSIDLPNAIASSARYPGASAP